MKSNETHIKSANAYWGMGLVLLLGAGVLLLLGGMFLKSALRTDHVQIFELAFSFALLGAFVYAANILWNFDTLYIYVDRMDVKSIFGYHKRTILFDDIIAWGEDVGEEKNKEYYTLNIYTASGRYKIYSLLYVNYASIRGILTSTAKRDYDRQRARYKRRKLWNTIILFAIAAILVYVTFYSYSHRNDDANANPYSIVLLKDALAEQPEIHKSKSRRSINIDLKNYSKFHFDLSGNEYRATYAKAFIRDVHIGDTVYVGILRSEYRKKIKKDMPLTFWEKHVNYNRITVYDLSTNYNSYLDVVNINKETDGAEVMFWIIMFFAGMVMFNGIKQLHDYAHYE